MGQNCKDMFIKDNQVIIVNLNILGKLIFNSVPFKYKIRTYFLIMHTTIAVTMSIKVYNLVLLHTQVYGFTKLLMQIVFSTNMPT